MSIWGERREGFFCLWLPHYMAEIATICNAVFVQHTAPVSALLNILGHRFITQKTLIGVNVSFMASFKNINLLARQMDGN